MGIGVLNNVDRDWAMYQLESGGFFPTTELATSQGIFELNQISAQKLLLAIESGEDSPSFNWTTAGDAATFTSAADSIANNFKGALNGGLWVMDMLDTALRIGRENLRMSSDEDLFYTDYVKIAQALSMDCYVKGNDRKVSDDFLTGLYNAAWFAMSVVVGLRGVSKASARKFIDRNRPKLDLNADNIYDESDRNKFRDDLRRVAAKLDGKKGLSDDELLAADAVYHMWMLDENKANETVFHYFRDLSRTTTNLTSPEKLALTALVGAYHYLKTPRPEDVVFYVTLDDFEFKSDASELSGLDPQRKTEIIRSNIRKTIEDTYSDIRNVKIVYEKPADGGAPYHTVFIPGNIEALSKRYRNEPPSKENCYSAEKRLSKGDDNQRTAYGILKKKYAPDLTSLCETPDYSELMAELLMIFWSHWADSLGITGINPGSKFQARLAYVYGHLTHLGAEILIRINDKYALQFQISMNDSWRKTLNDSSLSAEDRFAILGNFIGSVAAHEMGHLLGLSDLSSKYQGGKPHLMMMKRESGRRLNEPRERHLLCEKHKTLLKYFFR